MPVDAPPAIDRVLDRVLARLRALSSHADASHSSSPPSSSQVRGGASGAYSYPDTDNQMEDGVFSFAKRTDERDCWSRLVPAHGVFALDAGCGLGAHARALADRFRDVVLVDADLGRARAAADNLGWKFGERVFSARIDDGSLEHEDFAGAFDFVQLVQVLGHVPMKSVSSSLRAMRHVLRDDGMLLCAVPFAGTPMDLFFVTTLDDDGVVRPKQVDVATYDQRARDPREHELPVRHFSMTSVLAAFTAAGFVVEKTEPYHWFSHDTGDLFIVARKRV